MSAEVDFENPPNCCGWSQSTEVVVDGIVATKTVTRTYDMKDGSKQVLTNVSSAQLGGGDGGSDPKKKPAAKKGAAAKKGKKKK